MKKGPKACNLIKKETLAQVFSYEFCEISKNIFFTEYLRTTDSVLAVNWFDFESLLALCKCKGSNTYSLISSGQSALNQHDFKINKICEHKS